MSHTSKLRTRASQAADPPAEGKKRLFWDEDGVLCSVDSEGSVVVAGGGSGTYFDNPIHKSTLTALVEPETPMLIELDVEVELPADASAFVPFRVELAYWNDSFQSAYAFFQGSLLFNELDGTPEDRYIGPQVEAFGEPNDFDLSNITFDGAVPTLDIATTGGAFFSIIAITLGPVTTLPYLFKLP